MRSPNTGWDVTPWRWLLLRLLPSRFFYADEMTWSAERLLKRIAVGCGTLLTAGIAVLLLGPQSWSDVLAGAMLAWSSSILVWAVSSYRRDSVEMLSELRRDAEIDVLHQRLNEIAAKVGASEIDIDTELGQMIAARTERLAHFARLDEFR
jgi:hypothetical protein